MSDQLNEKGCYFLVRFECGDEQDEVAIGEAIGEVELVIAPEDEVEVKALGWDCCEVADEAGVGLVAYLAAQLLVLLQHLSTHHPDITHL